MNFGLKPFVLMAQTCKPLWRLTALLSGIVNCLCLWPFSTWFGLVRPESDQVIPKLEQIISMLCTLPVQKKVAHSNISSDRLLLWLRSAFAVALFRQPYAMSQHLFPSRVALIFGRDFVLMTGESNHSFTLFQHIPKTFNGVKSGLCGGQFMCENDSSCSLTLMCPHAPLFHN